MEKTELKEFARMMPGKPGVYQMKNSSGKIIYVGKAKNLKNRVMSYFTLKQESAKTLAMIRNIAAIDYVATNSETEALLLESNLIKEYKPRYNITFRDDKSYPYLYLSSHKKFPSLSFYRGARNLQGKYFGPYPSAGISRKTLNVVQKIFKLRQCDDSFFNNRNRPCLQYQIGRCSASCVGLISESEYASDIHLAEMFMEGKNERVLTKLTGQMSACALDLDYEKAAKIRDQITMLRTFQESQHIVADKGEADYIVCAIESEHVCIQVFVIRGGRNLGSKTFFPILKIQQQPEEIITAFIKQYYLNEIRNIEVPENIYTSHIPDDIELIIQLLKNDKTRKKIHFSARPRGNRAKVLELAKENVVLTLRQKLAKKLKYQQQFENLSVLMNRDEVIQRIECFDISHHAGKDTMGSCVVFGASGPKKSEYRKYTVKDVNPGDDYQAMGQVIRRRYSNLLKNDLPLPDIILIDGGKGQLSKTATVLNELQLGESIQLLGIAKGPGRKPGLEKLYIQKSITAIRLEDNSTALHLLQEVRDEAHRFAVSGHRNKSNKVLTKSPLDDIDGVGSKRKQRLIVHFGGMQGIKSASIKDIEKVPGISKGLAERIYARLH